MQPTNTAGTSRDSPLDAVLTVAHEAFVAARPPRADEDVHMIPEVVDHVVDRCTRPGDLVLDPFAGYGTTLARAVALDRRAVGVELLPERVEHVRRHVPDALVVEGDARELLRLLPETPRGGIDLVVTSPPYMTANDHEADPLTAYEEEGGSYARYLHELGLVAAQCAELVRPGGYVVWNVADIHHLGVTTHLADDCLRVLSGHLTPAGVTTVEWDRLPHDLVRDVLLVLRR